MSGERERSWHLDKKVPIAIIAAVLLQTLALGFWVGTLNSRLENVERWIKDNRKVESRLSVLESQISDIKDIVKRTEDRLFGRFDQ